jgi:D-glycero-D-manno-heptose 1,7-bisphosphate phosphatase
VRPAVFLDRDGTLIELVHHLTDPDDVRLVPGTGAALRRICEAGFAAIVVTNQSVIGRGLLTEARLGDVHAVMHALLAAEGAAVDAVYFCPTAPTVKDPTVIEDPMRKPGPGMLIEAATDHGIDLARSWIVGDTVSDMLAGRNAGCRTVLVRTGYGGRYAHPYDAVDAVASDLAEAAEIILSNSAGRRVEKERS